jgi:hypothetical protein
MSRDRKWAFSAFLFLAPEEWLPLWRWEKVPPDPVEFPVDEYTLHIAWAESVGWPWPPEEMGEVELRVAPISGPSS